MRVVALITTFRRRQISEDIIDDLVALADQVAEGTTAD